MMKNRSLFAVVLLLIAAVAWGGQFAVGKHALMFVDQYYLSLIRYSFVVAIFLLLLYWYEGKQALNTQGKVPLLFFLGTLGFAGFNLLMYKALAHSKPEHGAIIMALMPMITILVTWLMKKQRPGLFTLLAVIVAFSGVFLVITGGQPQHAFDGGNAEWDLLFLSGATCWVLYSMGAQYFPDWSPLRFTTLSCVFGTISLAVITLILTLSGTLQAPGIAVVEGIHWSIAYLAIPGGVIAVLCWNTGLKILGAVNGVLFINFVPVTALAIGIAQGHSFSVAEITGASLVIGALIANNMYISVKQKKVLNEPVPG